MKFNVYENVRNFYRDVKPILLLHEVQNMIMLGNLMMGNEGKDKHGWRDPVNWLMATVTIDDAIVLTALMTPPFGIILYATDNQISTDALTCLIDSLVDAGRTISGVICEPTLAEYFARMYTAKMDMKSEVTVNLRIYELDEVNPGISKIGALRKASESDMAFLPYWIEGMTADCYGHLKNVEQNPKNYLYQISTSDFYVLEVDGMPVSMAKIARKVESTCGIGYVYTPPYLRGKGYASACVATLSALMLNQGFLKCALYTDLANPTSNSIYQKIGYAPVCDSIEIKFIAE
ncbi:MAG: GNAT family N-acetyltransferase [Defluviitaleaceae bacterium]|nr:GNAT family N-acetyltransferase [Defluviitaleaceae bacterium]